MKVLPTRVSNPDYCFVNNSFDSSMGTSGIWKCENLENILSLQHFQDFMFPKKTSPPLKVVEAKEN
jgi:hypothetical protein